jgi:hypothetical protein
MAPNCSARTTSKKKLTFGKGFAYSPLELEIEKKKVA